MNFWLKTCFDDFSSEFDDIEEMFNRGLKRLLLSKRGGETAYERWLLSLPMELRSCIWVEGSPDLAKNLEVHGAVVAYSSLPPERSPSWKNIHIIAKVNKPEDIEKVPLWVDNILIGPIFPSFSSVEYQENLGVAFLENNPKTPSLILSGGIDIDPITQIEKFPIAGFVSLGGIWNYADPINAFIKLNRCI